MTKTKAQKMTDLLDSCDGGYAQFIRLVSEAIEGQWADDTDEHAELRLLLEALLEAQEAAELLDEVSQ